MANIRYPVAVPYFPPQEHEAILAHVSAMLRGEAVLSMGPHVRAFEQRFAAYSGVPHAVAMSSCSAALEIALRIMNIQLGDEVIVPTETFIATGTAVVREGGTPIFAEIHPETFCLCPEDFAKKITPRTKACILVHMAGLITPHISTIRTLCRDRRIVMIEDAAHAPGAAFEETKAGAWGDFGCFSFYPTKSMTTGEGGMLVTANPEYAMLANSYRQRGLDVGAPAEQYARLGTNNRMSEMAALLGLSQLAHLDAFVERRNQIAQQYHQLLAPLVERERVILLMPPANGRHAYWRFIVRTHESIDRMQLRQVMAADGVAIDWAYDPPLHLQPVFRARYGCQPGMLPQSETLLRHFVCLPMHMGLSDADVTYIAERFCAAVETLCG